VGRPTWGRCWSSGGAQVICVRRRLLILNEIWAQDKIIYFGRYFARLKYFTYKFQYQY
jgi:hypothetical protein